MTDNAIIFAPTANGTDMTIAIGAVHHDPQNFGIAAADEFQLKAAGRIAGMLRFDEDKTQFEYDGHLPQDVVDHVVGYIRNFKESA